MQLIPVNTSNFQYFKFPFLDYILKYQPEPNPVPWLKKSFKTREIKELDPKLIVDLSVLFVDKISGNLSKTTGAIFITEVDKNVWYWDSEMVKPFPLCDIINLSNPLKGSPLIITNIYREELKNV